MWFASNNRRQDSKYDLRPQMAAFKYSVGEELVSFLKPLLKVALLLKPHS